MTVGELLHQLEDCDADAEVRIAFQPEWPLEYKAGQVLAPGGEWDEAEIVKDDDGWYIELFGEPHDGPFEDDKLAYQALLLKKAEAEKAQDKIVYISEGGQIGYLPAYVAKAFNW